MFASKLILISGLWLIFLAEFNGDVAARTLQKRSVGEEYLKKYFFFNPSLAHDTKIEASSESASGEEFHMAGGEKATENMNGGVVKGVAMSPTGNLGGCRFCP